MLSIECGKVIRSPELIFTISCNFCLANFAELKIFSSHFNSYHSSNVEDQEVFEEPEILKVRLKNEIFEENFQVQNFEFIETAVEDVSYITNLSTQNNSTDFKEECISDPTDTSNYELSENIQSEEEPIHNKNERTVKPTKQNQFDPLGCPFHKNCKERYENQDQLDKHLKEDHGDNQNLPFKCPLCPKIFKMKAKLNVHHKRVHLRERRFKCSLCEKGFFDNTDRLIHERTHKKKAFCACEVCDMGFTTFKSLIAHKNRKHNNISNTENNIDYKKESTKSQKTISKYEVDVNNENKGENTKSEERFNTNEKNLEFGEQKETNLQKHLQPSVKCSSENCKQHYENQDQLDKRLKEDHVDNQNLPFKCPLCPKIFKMKAKLNVHHRRVHLRERRFKCSLCEKRFFDNTDRFIHERTHKKKAFCACEFCDMGFTTFQSLIAHKNRKHNNISNAENNSDYKKEDTRSKKNISKYEVDPNYQNNNENPKSEPCNTNEKNLELEEQEETNSLKHLQPAVGCPFGNCKEYCENQDELDKHLKEYHGDNPNLPFKCPICQKIFKMKAKLNVHHKRVHLRERRFKCSLCEKRFFENTDRVIHERTHTKEPFCVCEVCGQGFTTFPSLRAHMNRKHNDNPSSKKSNIDYKEENTNDSADNSNNQTNIDNENIQSEIDNVNENSSELTTQIRFNSLKHLKSTLRCPFKKCKEHYGNKEQLDKHLQECHSDNPDLPFKCSICTKLFKMKDKLQIHHKRVHLRERRFKCSTCEKRFFENTDRIIHERTHTKETFCVCEVCGKGFKTNSSLRAHRERRHSVELNMVAREYKCKTCEKSFSRKDYLKSHSVTHSKEKKYICNICSMSFSWSSGLKRHMNVHNNERDFVCKLCEKDFTSKIRITCHMNSHGLPYIDDNVYRKSKSWFFNKSK